MPTGTFRSYGGVIPSSRIIQFGRDGEAAANIIIEKTRFVKVGTTRRREVRFDNSVAVNGSVDMIVDGFQVSHRILPPIAKFELVEGQIVQLARGPTSATLTDLDASKNIDPYTDLGSDSQDGGPKTYIVNNSENGTNLRFMPKSGVGDTRQQGILRVFKSAEYAFSDAAGNAIEDVRTFIRDTDNGHRKNANSLNRTADITYTGLSDSEGKYSVNIETGITNINSQGHSIDYTDSTGEWDSTSFASAFKVDRRGLADDGEDEFRAYFHSYGYLPSQTVTKMKGRGTLSIPWTLFADPSVTVSATNAANYSGRFIVSATTITVTHNATLDELYDYLKYLKTTTGMVEQPNAADLIGTADGKILDVGSLDVTVSTGTSATLSAGDKFDFLRTTGTATGDIRAGLQDSTGVTAVITPEHTHTAMYYRTYDADGRYTVGYIEPANNTDAFRLSVPEGGRIVAAAKSPRRKFRKFTVQASSPTYTISLESEPHVQNEDLSSYIEDPDGAITNNMYAEYNTEKTALRYGKIDLSAPDDLETSKTIVDDRMSSEDGLRFLFNFPESRLEQEYLIIDDSEGTNTRGLDENGDVIANRSFVSGTSDFIDWTSHEGLVFGLLNYEVRVFTEGGTHMANRDFHLPFSEDHDWRSISYDEGYLYVADGGAVKHVAAFVAPTLDSEGGARDTSKEYALDPDNTDPRGADHYNDRQWVMDGTAKRTFNYRRDGTRDPPNQINLINGTPRVNQNPVGLTLNDNARYVNLDGNTGWLEAYTKSGNHDPADSLGTGLDPTTGGSNAPVLRGVAFRNSVYHVVYTQGSDIKINISNTNNNTWAERTYTLPDSAIPQGIDVLETSAGVWTAYLPSIITITDQDWQGNPRTRTAGKMFAVNTASNTRFTNASGVHSRDFDLDKKNVAPAGAVFGSDTWWIPDYEFHEMYTYGEFGTHEEDEYFELSEHNVRVSGVLLEGTQVLVTDQSTGSTGAAIHVYNTDGTRPSSEISAHDLSHPRNIAHLFADDEGNIKTYVLDVGTVQGGTQDVIGDDSTIRAFNGTERDEDNDIDGFDDTVSMGAGRKYGTWPDSVMDGRPYLIQSDRIQYNTDKMELLRLPGMTSTDLSKAGIYVVDKAGALYTAPYSYNGRVTFNSSQTVTPVHGQTLQEVLERLLRNETFLEGIKEEVEEAGVGRLLKLYQNKLMWTGDRMVIFDDDDSTPLYRADIDSSGNRSPL